LYAILKRGAQMGFPVIPGVHHLLLGERKFRKGILAKIWSKVYHEPLFKLQCKSIGRGLYLYENMPKILGNLEIAVGNRLSMSGEQVWIGAGTGARKFISIGDDSYIGHASQLIVGSEIRLGNHVLIANRVILNGYDGHPLDPFARAAHLPPEDGGFGAIEIGDYAWIGNDSMILKNVKIGRGAVVASGSIVTQDVPDLTVVGGIPARVIKKIDPPEGWLHSSAPSTTSAT
jgi:acetyltransferase-like isoleucine patch superfamily enzyme